MCLNNCILLQNLPNLEIFDLSNSKKLIECPNMSGSPNLKYVRLNGCLSLPEVDSSIFFLQKLESLIIDGCTSLKSISSNTCSPALRHLSAIYCINLQEFSVAFSSVDNLFLCLPELDANKFPSSILHTKNLEYFLSPISDSLVDLPENFANCIWLVNSLKGERDSSITLHKILPSPAFLSVKHLILFGTDVPFLSEIPDNISLLSSLKSLRLVNIAIRSLPETIMYLPQLEILGVYNCKMLQSIPALSQFIPYFIVRNCKSLEKVLRPTSEPFYKRSRGLLLLNCIKLDPLSYRTVLEYAIFWIEVGARKNSENEDMSLYYDNGIIWYFLPAMPGIEYWFHHPSTQVSVTLELPPNLLGFAYYMVLSPGHMGYGVDFGCECYLDNSSGERIYITSFTRSNFYHKSWDLTNASIHMMSHHVVLWYDPQSCKQIMEAVEETKFINDVSINYNPKLTFRFFIEETQCNEEMIVECGFHWMYPFEARTI